MLRDEFGYRLSRVVIYTDCSGRFLYHDSLYGEDVLIDVFRSIDELNALTAKMENFRSTED